MDQYDIHVNLVMEFLKTNGYSASVISAHRICYKELRRYLASTHTSYTLSESLAWLETTKMLGLTGCIRAEGSVFISWKMSTYLVLFRQIILAHMHQPIRCLFQNCKKNWMILLIMTNMYMEMAGTGFPVQDFYTISRNVQLPVSRS